MTIIVTVIWYTEGSSANDFVAMQGKQLLRYYNCPPGNRTRTWAEDRIIDNNYDREPEGITFEHKGKDVPSLVEKGD